VLLPKLSRSAIFVVVMISWNTIDVDLNQLLEVALKISQSSQSAMLTMS